MGSNISAEQKSSTVMNSRNIEAQPTSNLSNAPSQQPILKSILKNKHDVPRIQTTRQAVKMVELYVCREKEWKMERIREDEVDKRRKELKSDKAVNRTYLKPIADDRYLYTKY